MECLCCPAALQNGMLDQNAVTHPGAAQQCRTWCSKPPPLVRVRFRPDERLEAHKRSRVGLESVCRMLATCCVGATCTWRHAWEAS